MWNHRKRHRPIHIIFIYFLNNIIEIMWMENGWKLSVKIPIFFQKSKQPISVRVSHTWYYWFFFSTLTIIICSAFIFIFISVILYIVYKAIRKIIKNISVYLFQNMGRNICWNIQRKISYCNRSWMKLTPRRALYPSWKLLLSPNRKKKAVVIRKKVGWEEEITPEGRRR